jgi:hypothetical protein
MVKSKPKKIKQKKKKVDQKKTKKESKPVVLKRSEEMNVAMLNAASITFYYVCVCVCV